MIAVVIVAIALVVTVFAILGYVSSLWANVPVFGSGLLVPVRAKSLNNRCVRVSRVQLAGSIERRHVHTR